MARFKINPKDVGREMVSRERAVRSAIGRSMRRSARRARAIMVIRSPKDNGMFKAAWKDNAEQSKGPARAGMVASVTNDAPYAGVIERGARPHGVSEEGQRAIYEWVRRHFRFTTTVKRGANAGKQSKPKSVTGEAFEDPFLSEVTFGIVMKLKREGQKGRFIVRNERPALTDAAAKDLIAEISKVSRQKPGARR